MNNPDPKQIRQALDFLRLPGPGLIEITAFDKQGSAGGRVERVASGLFDNVADAVKEAADLDAEGEYCLYTVINPVEKHVLQRDNRAINAIERPAGLRALKEDAAVVQTVLVDVDPASISRPALVDEIRRCERAARKVLSLVRSHSGAALLRTGNGTAVWFRTDLPPGEVSRELVQKFLLWLAREVKEPGAKIDTGVYDQARLTALPGTTKRKLKDFPAFTSERSPRPVELVETFDGSSPDAFAVFLRGLPTQAPARISPSVQGPTATPGTSASADDLCPGWRMVMETVDEWPFGHDLSPSATAWRLINAMRSRTGMEDDQIVSAVHDWGASFANTYADRKRVAADVARILGRNDGEPRCADAALALGRSAPCHECPEYLFRPSRGRWKNVIVRHGWPAYTRPPLDGHLRDPLGDSLDEARWRLGWSIEDAVDWAMEHRQAGGSVDAVLLFRVGAGVGKTHQAVRVMKKMLSRPDGPRFIYLTESYRTAHDVLKKLARGSYATHVRLFHPKLDRDLGDPIGSVQGYCQQPKRIEDARSEGARNDYQLACRRCPDLRSCMYRKQLVEPVSYISVHDQAMSLLGRPADRGNLPTVGIFDEDPRRIYHPKVEGFTEDDLRQLDADHPTAAPAVTHVLRRGAAEPRRAPRPLVEAVDAFRDPTGAARTALAQLVQTKVTGRSRQLINALHSDVSGKRPFRVWLASQKYPYRAERNRRKVRAVVGVVTVNQFQLHDEILALVLDATAHPGLLETGLGRDVIADSDQVVAGCEVWQIPVAATRAALKNKNLQKQIKALLRMLDAQHTKSDPLGLITNRQFLSNFRPTTSRVQSRIDGYFGGIRGTNVFHDKNVRELVIVGSNIPGLTDFATLSTSFVEHYQKRVPGFSTTTRYVSCGLKWEGMDIATSTMSYEDVTVAALLDRECAAEQYQAAYRVRPHVAGELKRIWLIGTQPLWDLPTTRLLTLGRALSELRSHTRPAVRGRPRLKRQAALVYIRQVHHRDGRVPTRAEIAREVGCKKKTAQRALGDYKKRHTAEDEQDEE